MLREGRAWFDPAVDQNRFVAEARDPAHLALLRRLGFTSEMVVPLLARGQALGTITLVFGPSGRRHRSDDLALAGTWPAGRPWPLNCPSACRNGRQRRRFRTSVENLLDCLGIFSTVRDDAGQAVDFRIEYMNTAGATSIGLPAHTLMGRSVQELPPPTAAGTP